MSWKHAVWMVLARLPLGVLGAVFLVVGTAAKADDYDWNASLGGTFGNLNNWVQGAVPGPADRAVFDLGADYAVRFSADRTNESLAVEDDAVRLDLRGRTYELTGFYALVAGRSAGQRAVLTVDGGTLSTANAVVGWFSGSNGHVKLVNGAAWRNGLIPDSASTRLYIGGRAYGTVEVNPGTTLEADSVTVGDVEESSVGLLRVTGPGASASLTGSLDVGYNDGATGALSITGGGTVETASSTWVGHFAGSYGEATVSGAGSELRSDLALEVGASGTGTLVVADGGFVRNGTSGYLGHYEGGTGAVTVTGAGSRWESLGGVRVGYAGNGILRIFEGGVVSSARSTIALSTGGKGQATVSGTGSRWTLDDDLHVGYSGSASLNILDGGQVTSQEAWIGREADSDGEVTVDGAGSVWTVGADLFLGQFGGTASLAIGDGALVDVAGSTDLYENDSLELSGGTLRTDRLYLRGDGASVSGYGTVEGKVINYTSSNTSITAAGGKLTLGDPTHFDGFLDARANVTVQSDATLELLDSNDAWLYNPLLAAEDPVLTLTGGVLIARNGLYLPNNIQGYGVVVGYLSGGGERDIANPTGRVNLTTTLRVGSSVAQVFSDGLADLGTETTISGGSLVSRHGVRVGAGDVLSGYGSVIGGVALDGGVLAADAGKTLTISGMVSGHGVLLGNVDAATNPAVTGTVDLADGLEIGAREARVRSAGPASLGAETSIAGGRLAAADALLVRAEQIITGYGLIDASVQLDGGALEGVGAGLMLTGTISGKGVLFGTVDAASIDPAAETLVLTGVHDFGSRDARLYSAGPVRLEGAAALGGGTITADHGIRVAGGGRLSGQGTIEADVVNGGRITASGGPLVFTGLLWDDGGAIDGGVVRIGDGGLFLAGGPFDATLQLAPGGEVRLLQEKHLRGGGSANSNSGLVSMFGGTAEFSQDLTNEAAGLISGHGTLIADGGLTNRGTIAFSGPAGIRGDVTNDASGLILVSGGGPATFFDDVTFVSGSEIRTSFSSFSVFFGEVTGQINFTGPGTVLTEGDLKPGESPASASFGGNLMLGPDATTHIELGGDVAGNEFDQINVAGSLTLDGTLRVGLLGDFVPLPGDEFPIVTYGSRSGQFDAVVNDTPHAGLLFDVDYDDVAGEATLTADAALLGDVDLDADVDSADLEILLAGFGTLSGADWLDGDLSGDGRVEDADLNLLLSNFGASLPAAGPLQTVPEPSAFLLALLGLLGLPAFGRWKRSRAWCGANACVAMWAVLRGMPTCPRKRGHGTRLFFVAVHSMRSMQRPESSQGFQRGERAD